MPACCNISRGQAAAAAGRLLLCGLLLVLCAQSACGLSATLYDDGRCLHFLRGTDNIASGKCFPTNQYSSAIINCQDGAAAVEVFLGQNCVSTSRAAAGRGAGDGANCIPLVYYDGSGENGVRVDCSAPGPDSKEGMSTEAIIGIAAGAIVGCLLLLWLGYCLYSRCKAASAAQLRASLGMAMMNEESSHSYAVGPAAAGGRGANRAVFSNAIVACAMIVALAQFPMADAQTMVGRPEEYVAIVQYWFPAEKLEAFLREGHCAGHIFASASHLVLVLAKASAYFWAPVVGIAVLIKLWESHSKDKNTTAWAGGIFAGAATWAGSLGLLSFLWTPFFNYAASAHKAGECSNFLGLFWITIAPVWAVLTSKVIWGCFIAFVLFRKLFK